LWVGKIDSRRQSGAKTGILIFDVRVAGMEKPKPAATRHRFTGHDGQPKPVIKHFATAVDARTWLEYTGRFVLNATVYDNVQRKYLTLEELYLMMYNDE
jgi:hypothetical protein